jgi:5-formyltetrahydrofolate cyclo-ligase
VAVSTIGLRSPRVEDKQEIRERVWRLMRRRGVGRFPGAEGRIPNFVGAERAARLLAEQPEWLQAGVLKANPDAPQLPVRALALEQSKIVYVAVPRLREARPFILLDPRKLAGAPRAAASIKGSFRLGRPVAISQVRRIDLVVCGSVAVNREGARVGKGGGFSDLEFALLSEARRIDRRTVVATTVHSHQVLDQDLPETDHDFRVDLIVTPDEVIRVARRSRPKGIVWEDLDDDKVAQIPVLARRRRARRTTR